MDFLINFKWFSTTRTVSIKLQWVEIAIIASVLVASTVIAYWGSPRIFVLLLVLLVGIVTIITLARQPNLGFIFIFVGGMFVSFTGPSGLNMSMVMVALMLGLWITDMFIVQRNFVLIRSRVMLPVIVFTIIAILAFGMGQIPWFVFARQAPLTAQVAGFMVFIFSIGGMLLSAHLIKDSRWLKMVVWGFLILAAIYVLSTVFKLPFISNLYNMGYVAQSMSWTWLITLAFSQLLYNNNLTNRTKGMLIALIILTFYIGAVQNFDWKSGWVPAALAVLILLGLRYRRLVIFAIPFLGMATLYAATKLIGTDEYSWGTRNDAWRIILEISRVSPLLGMGFANYYWYTPLFPIRGWHVSFNSHSQYVDLIAQTGYLGLIGFLWVFLAIGRLSFNLGNRLSDGFERAYAYGIFAGVIATLLAAYLGDWVLPFVYNVGLPGFRASILPWIFLGGVISLEQMFLHNPAYHEITSSE